MINILHSRRMPWLALAVLLAAVPASAHDIPNTLVVVDTTEVPPYWGAYLTDPELRRSHGEAARERAAERFVPEKIWGALCREYAELLGKKGLGCPPLDGPDGTGPKTETP